MTLNDFRAELQATDDYVKLIEFTQRHILHGTPYVFKDREQEFYNFKRRLCEKFEVTHTEIFIVGSAKLGFSPHKGTEFTLNSDVDLAIVSGDLFSRIAGIAADLEYLIRSQVTFLREHQWSGYHKYIRYLVIGWMRPDLLPRVDPCAEFKDQWFSFFEEISYGKSEVGNYKVTAGVFRSQRELERYTVDSVKKVRNSLLVGDSQ